MKGSRLIAGTALLLLGSTALLSGQDDSVRVTHRFAWHRSVDKKYEGYVYGFLTGSWKVRPSTQVGWYDVEARYYLSSESRRDNALLERPIDAEKVSRFQVDPRGAMTGFTGDSVPYYRNFPAPLPAEAGPGTTWTGAGEVVADFLGTGVPTRIPLLVEYRWKGTGDYQGTPVIQVTTQYALRYRAGQDPHGDPNLLGAEGKRLGVVSYDAATRKVVFLQEKTNEAFTVAGGKTIGNEGVVLTFYEGVPALGTASMVEAFQRFLNLPVKPPSPAPSGPPSPGPTPNPGPTAPLATVPDPPPTPKPAPAPVSPPVPDVKVEADPRGVKLTLENLKFVADQAVLLPGEDRRLQAIAELLKSVPGRNLLVVGHTAAVGTVASQDKLSVDRALAIVQKLKAAGLPPTSLLYEGRGGRDPVATNDTETGRAQNRRVEILVLDQ